MNLSILKGPPLADDPDGGALTLPGFLRDVTVRYAGREALVFDAPEGTVRWTYAMLWERSIEVARALAACGVGKGSRVGVMMTNRPEMLASVFGASLAGGIVVAITTFATPSELDYLLQASGVSHLLFEAQVLKKDFADILVQLEPAIAHSEPGRLRSLAFPFLRHCAAVGAAGQGGAIEAWDRFLARGESVPPALIEAAAAALFPSDPATLFFSSGSTSRPKGIIGTHRAAAIQLPRWRTVFGLEDAVRSWSANGFFWSGPFAMIIGGTFACGGAIILQRTFSAAQAIALIERERVSLPVAMPHQWAQMEQDPSWPGADLSSLVHVPADSPPMRHPTVSTDWTGATAVYGGTETFTVATSFPARTPAGEIAGSHGRPLPGNTIRIVDPETGAVLPVGERGEIVTKGPTLMLGYIGIPAEETFDAEGYYRSGDAGYVDAEGRLFWEGRLSDIIRSGGINVSPLEIDAAIAAYPGVKAVKTVGVPHPLLGEMVVSCAVAQKGCALDEAGIRDFLKERIASYKVPRRILFFREEEMPMTGTAKIKAGPLRELAARRLDA